MTNKEKIKQLANKIGFESKMFADEFKFSNKEDLRYYLWLHELNKWVFDKTYFDCTFNHNVYNNELSLINCITFLIDNGTLKTK